MKLQTRSLLATMATVSFFALFATQVTAQTVTLQISGTYDTNGGTIFGESGSAVPYSYTIDYDPMLDTNSQFFDVGDTLGGSTTNHQWYGYSKSGIVSSDVTFGTKTFTNMDLDTPDIEFGTVGADFWLDTDLAVAAPTRAYFRYSDTTLFEGQMELSEIQTFGGGGGSTIQLNSYSRVFDFFGGGGTLQDFSVNYAVPEPGSLTLIGFAALGLGLRRRRRS